jgi:hypothetical protein
MPLDDRNAEAGAAAWSDHEQVTPAAQLQAQKLLDQAGSPELARHAVNQAARAAEHADREAALARECGYETYLDLFEASTPASTSDGQSRFVTAVEEKRWAVWDPNALKVVGWYDSLEEAMESVAGPP